MFVNKLKTFVFILLWLVTGSVTTSIASPSSSSSAQEIRSLLIVGKYNDAYQLADRSSSQEIGDPQFDYWFGKAAVSVQKYDVAALAFERVVMNVPTNTDAKLALANTYYQLKLYDDAKTAMQTLNPKTLSSGENNERQTLAQKIAKDSQPKNSIYRIYGNVSAGLDNNVGTTTSDDYAQFLNIIGQQPNTSSYTPSEKANLDAWGNNLRQDNKRLISNYVSPRLGIKGVYLPTSNQNYDLFWDINGLHKEYISTDNYNVDQVNLILGMNHHLNPFVVLSESFYYQEYLMDGKRYRETPMGTISLSRILSQHNTVKAYTNVASLAYPIDRSLSVNMWTGGLEWTYHDNYRTLLTQVFYGRNQPRDDQANYNGANFYGVNFSLKHKIIQDLDLTFGFAYQNSLYDAQQFPYATKRRDNYYQYTGGIFYRLTPNYTWYAQSAYTNNHSKVFVYQYNRLDVVTGVNFEF